MTCKNEFWIFSESHFLLKIRLLVASFLFDYLLSLGKSAGRILTSVNLLANRPTAHLTHLVKDFHNHYRKTCP